MSALNGQLGIRVGGGLVDIYAAGLSTLCLIHCLALPLLTSLLPLAGQLAESSLVHRALVLLAAPATLWVGWKSLLIKSSKVFVIVAFSGLGLLLLAAFIDALSPYEEPMTIAGALLLASAHLWHRAQIRYGATRRDMPSEADDRLGH